MTKPRTFSCCTVMCRSYRRSDRVSGDTTNTLTALDMAVGAQEWDERERMHDRVGLAGEGSGRMVEWHLHSTYV